MDAKARIFENQTPDDFAVLNADDPTCVEMAAELAALSSGSAGRTRREGAFVKDAQFIFRRDEPDTISCRSFRIPSKAHTIRKRTGSRCAAALMGCDAATDREQAVRNSNRRASPGYVATVQWR